MGTPDDGLVEGIGQISVRVRGPDRNLMALMAERPAAG